MGHPYRSFRVVGMTWRMTLYSQCVCARKTDACCNKQRTKIAWILCAQDADARHLYATSSESKWVSEQQMHSEHPTIACSFFHGFFFYFYGHQSSEQPLFYLLLYALLCMMPSRFFYYYFQFMSRVRKEKKQQNNCGDVCCCWQQMR